MKNNKGFTLVEIIVVLVILAVLAASVIPSLMGFVEQAKQKSIVGEARACMIAAKAFAAEKASNVGAATSDADLIKYIVGMNDKTGDNNRISPSGNAHVLYTYLKGDCAGYIVGAKVSSGVVTGLCYTRDHQRVTLKDGSAPKFETTANNINDNTAVTVE